MEEVRSRNCQQKYLPEIIRAVEESNSHYTASASAIITTEKTPYGI